MNNPSQDLHFYIEVVPGGGAVEAQDAGEKVIKATKAALAQVGGVIDDTAKALFDRVRKMEARPAELAIEFGVDAGGEAGIPLVTKGSLSAQFKVSLKWTFDNE